MEENSGAEPFGRDDLGALSDLVVSAWRSGFNRDWRVSAGTLSWSCSDTADHAVDTVIFPAIMLASRNQLGYPDVGWRLRIGPGARPDQLVAGLETATRILSGVILAAPPEARAVIRRRPEPQTAGPEDFAPRAGLELILHAHDVCSGLGVPFEPTSDLVHRLREHTRHWPVSYGSWSELGTTDDPWQDLLDASGRHRQLDNA